MNGVETMSQCRPRVLAFASLIVSACLAPLRASLAQPPAADLQRANAFFQQADWTHALEAYRALASAHPAHALSRFRLGVAQTEVGQFADAERNLREGERLGVPAGQSGFRLAQLFVESNRPDSAVSQLLRAAAAGFGLPQSALEGDRHLSKLKGNPKWSAVVDAFDAVIQPCKHDARFREFDFWIGDWDVRPTGAPASQPASRNTITLEENGCVVMEHWKGLGGSTGQSFNIFDRSLGLWRQTWVDNVGGQHDYRGSLKDGNMVFTGDTPAPNGRLGRVPTKLTFFHMGADSVRQFSEISNDGGKTWVTNYDLMYVRRKSGSPSHDEAGALADADRAAIRALDSVFVDAWLRDDTAAVLGVFSPDAVLLPPGAKPVVGLTAIRSYWWPSDGTHTRITSFKRSISEIEGTRRLAFLRGTGALAWDYSSAGKTARQTSRSTDLMVVAPDAAGRWRVVRQMWNTLP
jgi:uncharacterized protein (TIGR02246 family)